MSCVKTLLTLLLVTVCSISFSQLTERSNHFPKTTSSKALYQKNKGQIADVNGHQRPDILFKTKGKNGSFYIRETGVSYVQYKEEGKEEILPKDTPEEMLRKDTSGILKGHRVDIDFIDGQTPTSIIEKRESEHTDNFYLAHCPDGILNVKSYEEVTLKNIYPGVDAIHYTNNGQLEYDLLVAPGVDPSQIKMKISGAEKWKINKEGNLEIKTSLGVLIEKAPVVFQGNRQIPSSYIIEKGFLKFKIGAYDKKKELRIDPIRQWATYIGGANFDGGYGGVDTDHQGNVYVHGNTLSTNGFPITTGAFQTTLVGSYDAYLAKFTPLGALVWSTYYGGTLWENAYGGLACDGAGGVYIHGRTNSLNFPVSTGAFQTSNAGFTDSYLVKFNSSGVRQWATYYGGSLNENYWGDVVTDGLGNVIITGSTHSYNFPVTTGAFQTSLINSIDAYLVKFNSSGVRLWGTFIGGNGNDYGQGLAIHGGNIYVGGISYSSNFPVTAGAFQTTLLGAGDAFLMKFTGAGVQLWGTFYGGSATEWGNGGVATDTWGNVFIHGGTYSTNFPVSTGAYQTNISGLSDGYLVKFNGAGVRLWGTLYGGSSVEWGRGGIDTDQSGNAYVHGRTHSINLPVTTNAFQPANGGGGSSDAYLMQFSASGTLKYGTYYGGGNNEWCWGHGTASDGSGNVYIYGTTHSNNFPVSSGAHQDSLAGSQDSYLVKFSFLQINHSNDCQYDTVSFSLTDTIGASSILWNFGDTASGALNTSTLLSPDHIYNSYGVFPVSCIVNWISGLSDTLYDTLTINPTPIADLGPDTILCEGDSTQLQFFDSIFSYLWNTGDTTVQIPIINPGTYWVQISSICTTVSDTIQIDSLIPALVHLPPDTLMCTGDTLVLDAMIQSGSYSWNTGTSDSTYLVTNSGIYSVTATNLCGTDQDSIEVEYVAPPQVDFGPDSVLCNGDTLILNAWDTLSTFAWNSGDTIATDTLTTSGVYQATTTNFCGTDSDTIQVWFLTPPTANLGNDTIICTNDTIWLSDTTLFGSYNWNTGNMQDSQLVTYEASYILTVTNLCGTATDTVYVEYDTIPVIDLGADQLICQGDSVILSAVFSNSTYQWNTNQTDGTITVGTEGDYWVTTTNVCGTDSDSMYLNVDSTLQVDLGPDTVLCIGDVIWLKSNVSADSYLWNNGSTNDSLLVNQQGIYTLTANNICGAFTGVIEVSYDTNPITYLGPDSTYCLTNLVQLNASWSRANYLWNTGDTNSAITPDSSGVFAVKVTNLCGSDEDTVSINYDIPISFDLGKEKPLCDGDSFALGAKAYNARWLWSTGLTDSAIVINQPGVYWLEASNQCGSFRDSLMVLHFTLPETVNNPKDTTICIGEEVEIQIPKNNSTKIKWVDDPTYSYIRNIKNQGIYHYVLSNYCGSSTDSFHLIYERPVQLNLGEDTILCTDREIIKQLDYPNSTYLWNDGSTGNKRTIQFPGTYGVTVRTAAGCESYDEIKIAPCKARIYVPNAFTPDNDDLNNTFQVIGNELERFSITIYDRWGNEVFQSNDILESWDGTYQGSPALMGVYTYIIQYGSNDESLEKYGTVTLIR